MDISLPDYIVDVLDYFQHYKSRNPVLLRYPCFMICKNLYHCFLLVQQIIGWLLHYNHAIDNTIQVALNIIYQSQAIPTIQTPHLCQHLPDYCATFLSANIQFHASNTILHVCYDTSYLVNSTAKSWVADYFQLVNWNFHMSSPIQPIRPLLSKWKILQHVVTSSVESKTAAAFHNAQIALPIWYMLSCSYGTSSASYTFWLETKQ